ncbi:MAG: DUF937 domain-containing protein [Pseudomonadota bacterium]
MNILETVLKAAGGSAVSTLAKNFGLNDGQISSVIGQLVPALSRGMAKNTQSTGGLEDLLGALTKGNHGRYMEQPNVLTDQATTDDGNKILSHVLGGKHVSRVLAGRTAEKTGVAPGLIKKLLPIVASLAMGAMSQQKSSLGVNSPQSSGIGGLLSGFLDQDNDGSLADDLLGIAGKMFFR